MAGAAGRAALAAIDSLRVEGPDGDGVAIAHQKVAVLSLNPYLEPFFWTPVAGVLGYDFISRFVMEVDYDGATLTLHDPTTFRYAGKGQAVPMTMAGNIPVVKARLDGRYEGEFRLDVGSGSTVDLHRPFVDQVSFACPQCKGAMQRVPELIDVWFDSGAMPVAQWHFPFEHREQFRAQLPADLLLAAGRV